MIPVLDLPSDPYAAGRAHGRALAREARGNLALYREILEKGYGISFSTALRRAAVHLERLEAWAPEHLCGLLGLTEAAGLTPAEAALLDARYEIFYAEFAREECTALVVRPPRMASTVLGQNWDWFCGVSGAWVRLAEGPAVLAFTEAGVFGGKLGVSEGGFALALTGLVSPGDRWDGEGLPLHARTWRALRALSLSEALEILSSLPSPCSAAFLLAKEGEAYCVELSPRRAEVLPIEGEFFVHANHFRILPLRAGATRDWENSQARQARAEELLAGKTALTVADLFAILSDHAGFPQGICRHADPTLPLWEEFVTNLSCALFPGPGKVLFAPGQPCTANLAELSLTRTP